MKILDLGLARSKTETDSFLTKYVQTRWYRAPEVLLETGYDGRFVLYLTLDAHAINLRTCE